MLNIKNVNLSDASVLIGITQSLDYIKKARNNPEWATEEGQKTLDEIEAEAIKRRNVITGE